MLGRKLRTILTMIAIVLGVAMVSGTFVLTDSIDKAFGSIFTDVRKGSDAVITGKAATSTNNGSAAPDAAGVAARRRSRGCRTSPPRKAVSAASAQLIGRDDKAIVYGGAPNLGFSIANGASRFNPLTLLSGQLAARQRGRDRPLDGAQGALRRRRRDRRAGGGPGPAVPDLRAREVRLGLHEPRRGDARRLRRRDRAATLQQARPVRRDRHRCRSERLRPAAPEPGQVRCCPRTPRCARARSRPPRTRRTPTPSSRSCGASCSRSAASRCSSAAS